MLYFWFQVTDPRFHEHYKRRGNALDFPVTEEVTWEDIIYRLYVKRKIEEGIKAAEEGRTVPHDEVKELFAPE
jgi:hypothetical protein